MCAHGEWFANKDILFTNGAVMSSVKIQCDVEETFNKGHQKQSMPKTTNSRTQSGQKFGIVETYAIMQICVSIIILSMITQFWADEGNSSSPFLVLFIFQLFILAVALILLATGHDAWFSFVFAQLVLFMGIAELTTSAFVALRDTRLERCREFGCTIVKGSTFLRSRFISASALCGIFHTAIGVIYLILGPHCHDTPEPTIIISRDLITRLRNKISSVSRSGSTLHEMSRSPELNELADNQTLSQRCATTLSSATLRVPSESNDHSKLPYVLRVLERAKEIDSKNRLHEPLYNHAVLTSTTQADSSVSLSADRLSATLNECLRRDEGVALAEAAHENGQKQQREVYEMR